MAMLAEPKRKQKFGSDPRNTFWSNDDSKFGQRMLERMGWSKGKGLGANESGRTEHISTVFRQKDDTRGVGCSKNHADNWLAHQDDFNSLLESLNENEDTPTASSQEPDSTSASKGVVSLEKKSKSSRSRVHYHKFMRGKDLSSRSVEDLNCIFGKRKGQTSESNTPLSRSEANSDEESSNKETPTPALVNPAGDLPNTRPDSDNNNSSDGLTHGIKTITSTSSIQEYFAQKMAALKKKQSGGSESSLTSDNTSFHTSCIQQNKTSFADSSGVAVDGESSKGKKKKKKKRRRDSDTPEESSDASDVQQQEKQKETSFPSVAACHERDNSSFAASSGVDFDGDSSQRKKKKKKSRKYSEEEETYETFETVPVSHETLLHGSADKADPKSKKRKTKKSSEPEREHGVSADFAGIGNDEKVSEKMKKKKKNKKDRESPTDEYHVSSSTEATHTVSTKSVPEKAVCKPQEELHEVKNKADKKAKKRKYDQLKNVSGGDNQAEISGPDSTVDGFNVPSSLTAEGKASDSGTPSEKSKKKKMKHNDTEEAESSAVGKRKKSVRFSLGGDDLFIPGTEVSIDPSSPSSEMVSVCKGARKQEMEVDDVAKTEKKRRTKKKNRKKDSFDSSEKMVRKGESDRVSDSIGDGLSKKGVYDHLGFRGTNLDRVKGYAS